MKWEELTAPEFSKAVEVAKGVCLLSVGCLEKHGEHLPLGTDTIWGQTLAEKVAEVEPAIVFPQYYFGQINCARHEVGAVAIRHKLLLDLLENVCDEISRNGMKKIILLNAHGGNEHFLQFFAQVMLERKRDYVVYVIRLGDYGQYDDSTWNEMRETAIDGHGGECETSQMLAIRDDLVKMDAIVDNGMPQERLSHLPGVFTGIWWYADYPNQYAGDGRHASTEKGEYLLDYQIKKVAKIVKAIKADTKTQELTQEFYSRMDH